MTQSSDMRNSVLFFKQVPEGYVFRAPNPWLFGRADHYLVSEAQRDEIGAILFPRRPARALALYLAIWIGIALTLLAGLAGIVYFASDHLSVAGNIVMVGAAVAGTLLLLFGLVQFSARRNLRRLAPILAGAQRTDHQITNAEMRDAARKRMSLKQSWLTAVAFGSVSLLALAALVFDRDQKLAFFSDGHSVGPMFQIIVFGLMATIGFRTALRKSEQQESASPNKASILARWPRQVVLGSALALLGLALVVVLFGARREFSDHSQGLRYEAKGEHDNAIASFSKAIATYPSDPAAYAGRAASYRAKGAHDLAIADFTKAIEIDPNSFYSHFWRSRSREAKGDRDGAIADLTAAIEINPKDANAYVSRARIFVAKGDHDRAMADFAEAIAVGPRYSLAHFWRGTSLAAKGDHDGAIEDFTKALEIHPKDPNIYILRARSYEAKGNHGLSVADFTSAIENKPDFALAYRERASAYANKGERENSIADFTKAIELSPKDVFAHVSRGVIFAAKNDHDHAIADFTKALALDPINTGTYVARGRSFAAKNDQEHAIADFSVAIAINPKDKSAYSSRAASHSATGARDLAIADYNTVLGLPSVTVADRQWQSQARERIAQLTETSPTELETK